MAPPAQALRNLTRRMPPGPADLRRTAGIENATRRLLLVGVMPLWLGAGLADWYLHRRTRIEETTGPRESARHSLMFAETGVLVLLGLFREVNAGVLGTAAGAVAAHSATAYRDQAYAEPRRRVAPVEQHVHSLLEASPIMATFLLTALHWDQAKALAGRDRQPPRFRPRLKRCGPLLDRARDALRRGHRIRDTAVRRGTAALLARQPQAQPPPPTGRTSHRHSARPGPGPGKRSPAKQTIRSAGQEELAHVQKA